MTRIFHMVVVAVLLGHGVEGSSQDPILVPREFLVVEEIRTEGNRVTKSDIIVRELVFGTGDTVLKMDLLPDLQRSRENLLNTSLFNFVSFEITHLPENRIVVHISVTERWYIWPVPILEYAERNFSTFIQNREWDKIVYGVWLKWNNFRGRNELLTGKVRLGYINEYALAYELPNLGKKQRHGLAFGFNMNQQSELFVSTVNNRPVEFEPEEPPGSIRLNAYSSYRYRRKLYTSHTIRFEYFNQRISDSVSVVNPNYFGEGRTRLYYFTLSYLFNHDIRDSKVYPLEGFAVRLRAEQVGVGMISEFPYPSFRLTGVFLFHQPLTNRLYFYNATKARYSSQKLMPYALNRGLGYNEFLSGYEPYVIDGSDYFITKYNLKLQVLKPTTRVLPFIRMEQFNKIHYSIYLNIFADAGYVNNLFPDPTSTLVNTWQFSAGIGLDFVTYYDQVFRVDYAINRYGERGFFFHIETPFYRW